MSTLPLLNLSQVDQALRFQQSLLTIYLKCGGLKGEPNDVEALNRVGIRGTSERVLKKMYEALDQRGIRYFALSERIPLTDSFYLTFPKDRVTSVGLEKLENLAQQDPKALRLAIGIDQPKLRGMSIEE